MEAREAATRHAHRRRRARRVKTAATLVGGGLAVSGLVWLSDAGTTDVAVTTDVVLRGTASDTPDAAALAATGLFSFRDTDANEVIVVRASSSGEPLAGALMVRDGFIVTSGAALADAGPLTVTWGDNSHDGTVIGHDDVTDMTVIQVAGTTPDGGLRDALVVAGDEITMPSEGGAASRQRVVAAESTSAKANGEPMVGIVELDGRIGNVPPGSPAYDTDGNVVGIATATADSAPTAIIPIELARQVADEIIDHGEATHPRLGVKARSPQEHDEVEREGSLVTALSADGPAETGGVLVGDLITLIDDRPVNSMASMVATLRSFDPGDVVNIVVWRDDGLVSCTVELASHLDVDA